MYFNSPSGETLVSIFSGIFFFLNKPLFYFYIFLIYILFHYIDRILYTVNTSFCVNVFLINSTVLWFLFLNCICISFNMHSSLSTVKRQDVLWLVGPGRAWPWHTPVQYRRVGGPDKPSQALTLEGSGRLLRKVTWQTTSCWQKRRATLGLFWKG